MSKNQLAIDINATGVRFVKLTGDFVVQEKAFLFADKQDYRYKQQLEEFWKETLWKESDFDDISLSWSGKETTLVPVNVFNESDKEALFHLTFGKAVQSNEIDYNRIPVQGLVNVYAIPLWVKSFFVIRFPRIVIQHEGTHLIRGVFSGQTFKLKTKLILHEQHFLMIVVKENRLLFYSTFEWSTFEDIVYYFSFTLQQLELSTVGNEVELAAGIGCTDELTPLKQLMESIHPNTIDLQISNHLIEKHQQLCV